MKKNLLRIVFFITCIIACNGFGFARETITSQGVVVYTVKKGDTLESIAREFSVSKTHVMKDNKLSDATVLTIGQIIKISPESGVSIILGKDTSVSQLAKQFTVAESDIISTNDFVSTGVILSGTEVFIPSDQATVVSALARPEIIISRSGGQRVDLSKVSKQTADAYMSTIFTQSFGITDITQSKGTILATWFQRGIGTFGFVAGQCTDYAASRRPDIFQKGKGFRGNAKDRATNARKAGYAIGSVPKKHAIAVFAAGKGGDPVYGHVAYVEQIDIKNNLIIITEMNYLGRNIITKRIVDSRLPIAYIY